MTYFGIIILVVSSKREFGSSTSLMNSSIVGVSSYLSMACYNSWSCIFLAKILASWLIFMTLILYCNWVSWLVACLFTLSPSVSCCYLICAIFASFSLNKIETLVDFSMLAVACALVKCDNLVKLLVGLEGMALQTMSIGSFLGWSLDVHTLPLFLYILTIKLCNGL